jgi:hypothetical protein
MKKQITLVVAGAVALGQVVAHAGQSECPANQCVDMTVAVMIEAEHPAHNSTEVSWDQSYSNPYAAASGGNNNGVWFGGKFFPRP